MDKRNVTIKVTRLRAERLKRCLTLEDVAKAINVAMPTMKAYELLQRTPRLETYRKLEEFYQTKDDLLQVVEFEVAKIAPRSRDTGMRSL